MPQTKVQPKLAALVSQLEQARAQIGAIPEKKLEQEIIRLLSAADRAAVGKDAESLIRFHDLLLFLRAFPPGPCTSYDWRMRCWAKLKLK